MPLLPMYASNFGATGTQLGFLTASFAITRAITTFPGGWLCDRVGRKKPITLGLFFYSIVMTLYGFSQDVNQLILLRALQGMASGIVWPIISTMIIDIVKLQDRSKALGLYEMMWFLGMIVGPALGGILTGLFTIAVPFFVCGALAFVSMILVVSTVQETAKVSCFPNTKSSINLNNDSVKETKLTLYPLIFLGLCIAQFIIAFSNSLIQPVLSVYANEVLGIEEVGVGMLFTFMGIATLFTTLPMGIVADKIGRKPMLIVGKILDSASAFLIIFSGSFWPLLIVMMIRGFGRGAVNPSITAMFSNVISAEKRGRGMGIFNTFQNVGLVVGSTIGGFLWEFSSSEMPFIACSVAGLIGVIIVLLMVSEPKQNPM